VAARASIQWPARRRAEQGGVAPAKQQEKETGRGVELVRQRSGIGVRGLWVVREK